VAYWLLQNGIKVMIAACDTFRSGAVEQLKTHCARLQVGPAPPQRSRSSCE
jgi:signal recognition particle receptor subunit alpha